MRAAEPPGSEARLPVTFQVYSLRDATAAPERVVWCVAAGGREMGRFGSEESALRAATAYARTALQNGHASSALVSRARADGTAVSIHLVPYP